MSEHSQDVQRRLRIVAILRGAQSAGLSPLLVDDLHNIAYFGDALAPVWGLRILDAQQLKRRGGAFSPVLQRDVDLLVGRGVVRPSGVSHRRDEDGAWRLVARYALVEAHASSVLKAASQFPGTREHVGFINELVHAMSALGLPGIGRSATNDATYADRHLDIGSVVDLAETDGRPNRSTQVALRFGTLLGSDTSLTSAEMIHLYVRELYKRLGHVA